MGCTFFLGLHCTAQGRMTSGKMCKKDPIKMHEEDLFRKR